MQSRSTVERVGPERRAGKRHPTTGISILTFKVLPGRRDTSAATAIQQGKQNGNLPPERSLIPRPRVTRHRTRDNQPPPPPPRLRYEPMIDSLLLANLIFYIRYV